MNVLDYGAIPDGSFDCTAAFQIALARAGWAGEVFVPGGRYRIQGPLELRHVRMIGSNMLQTFLIIDTPIVLKRGSELSRMTLRANNCVIATEGPAMLNEVKLLGDSTKQGTLLEVSALSGLRCQRCEFHGGAVGIGRKDSSAWAIGTFEFCSWHGTPLALNAKISSLSLSSCWFQPASDGKRISIVHDEWIHGLNITGCWFGDNTNAADIPWIGPLKMEGGSICGNRFQGKGDGPMISLVDSAGIIRGNRFDATTPFNLVTSSVDTSNNSLGKNQ